MSMAVVPQQPAAMQEWKSPTEVRQRIVAIQSLMNEALKKDTDYGIIPGMPKGTKPSLWKAGSEQILSMFRIAVEPIVEDLSTDDCYRYRVTTRLTNSVTQEFLGAGVGEASTDETKYKWRRTYVKAEYDATDPDRRRIKYGRYKNQQGAWVDTQEMQVRQEAADLANTVLKMAKKRSQIDATLTVTGASSMFEQDLEDLPEETQEEFARQREDVPPTQPAQRGGRKSPAPEKVICSECRAQNGHLPSCKYAKPPQAAAQAAPQPQSAPPPSETTAQAPKEAPAASNAEPDKAVVLVNKVERRQRTAKDKVVEYFALTCTGQDNAERMIFCFHMTAGAELEAKAAGKVCLLRVSSKVKQDKTFYQVEEILEIGGVQYKDGKPVTETVEAEEGW